METPKIISIDDHVIEPPDLWTRLPQKYQAAGPICRREKGGFDFDGHSKFNANANRWVSDPTIKDARWADVWYYEDFVFPVYRAMANSGYTHEEPDLPITYEQMLPAAYERDARLAMMAANHTDVSICFPSMPRFCGQIFSLRHDKEVALASLQVWNDWIIDEWCSLGTSASDATRLIPLTLIPLWDPELAAAEVRRCADKGSHAIAFSENPAQLGLPSIYSDYWDPMLRACDETDTVINMHVGSSSKVPTTAPDQPMEISSCLLYLNSEMAVTDWLYSGTLERFPQLRVTFPESHAGWLPFALQRIDNTWRQAQEKIHSRSRIAKELPSECRDRVYACIFDDLEGLLLRDQIGTGQILFETDFPHMDSTYPNSKETAEQIFASARMSADEIYDVLRGNAIRCYRLDKYFGIAS